MKLCPAAAFAVAANTTVAQRAARKAVDGAALVAGVTAVTSAVGGATYGLAEFGKWAADTTSDHPQAGTEQP